MKNLREAPQPRDLNFFYVPSANRTKTKKLKYKAT